MTNSSKVFGVCALLLAGTAVWPTTASAATRATSSATDVVSQLQAQGYDVQLNGQPNGALAQCAVTGVHPTSAPGQFGTAYVDLDCPGSD